MLVRNLKTNGFHGILIHNPVSMIKAMNSWATGSNNIYKQHYNIHSKVSMVKNPQSNAVAEHLHQMVTKILCSTLYANPPDNQLEAELLVDTALQKAAYAMRTTIHTTLKATPGSLVYQRDMYSTSRLWQIC